jgi:hypothetical protein
MRFEPLSVVVQSWVCTLLCDRAEWGPALSPLRAFSDRSFFYALRTQRPRSPAARPHAGWHAVLLLERGGDPGSRTLGSRAARERAARAHNPPRGGPCCGGTRPALQPRLDLHGNKLLSDLRGTDACVCTETESPVKARPAARPAAPLTPACSMCSLPLPPPCPGLKCCRPRPCRPRPRPRRVAHQRVPPCCST